MLKSELEKRVKELEKEKETLINNIHSSISNMIPHLCLEGVGRVKDFYDDIGLEIPEVSYTFKLPFVENIQHFILYNEVEGEEHDVEIESILIK